MEALSGLSRSPGRSRRLSNWVPRGGGERLRRRLGGGVGARADPREGGRDEGREGGRMSPLRDDLLSDRSSPR